MNCLQITHRESPLTVMSVCTPHSFSYSNPSLLFPYPLITFYIFPYFNTLVWQIVAILVHQISLSCLKELSNQVGFSMQTPFSSKFLNILWFPIQVSHFLPFSRVFYYSHYQSINNNKHLQIFMNCESPAVDSFQRAEQKSKKNGNKDCSVL